MKICLVSQEYPPETAKGGIGTQAYLKAHGLARLGHQVFVISRSTSGTRTSARTSDVQVTRIPSMSDRVAIHTELADWISYSTEVAAAVQELHKQVTLDLVEFPEWGCEGYVHLLNRTEWNHIPTVIQLHGPLVMLAHTLGWPALDSEFYRVGTQMEGTCLRLADAVYSSSHCSADWCAQHYGLKRKSIPVLHAGVDTQLFSPRPVPKAERPTIIFAGKIARNKGVFTLLEAALQMAPEFPNLHLRLLGRGEESVVRELKDRAAAAGWPDLLDLPGFVAREDLPDHLSRAHVFAAPSVYEGGPGFVYLEAMACGLPVIACERSGAAEVVSHNTTGMLVPAEDPAALISALRPLVADCKRREEMGRRAYQHAVETAATTASIHRLANYFRTILCALCPA